MRIDFPKNWSERHVEDVADVDKKSLGSKTPSNYAFDYISLSDVDSDEFVIERSKQVFGSAPSRARRIVKKGDILMSTVRPNLLGFSLIREDVKDLVASTGFAVLTARECSEEYLFQYLFGQHIARQFYQMLTGSNYPALSSADVRRLKIIMPPLSEQKAIARVLGTMDELISKTNRLIEQKKLRKKYLMQTLLTGKKRLKGFRKKWKTFPFRELATESVFRNGGKMSNDRLMAVSKVHGMIPMRERVQGVSNHRCKIVRRNYFAYNPMRLNIGSLARWDGEEPAMVSGDYVVFKCDEERLDPRFFDFYRSTNEWANYVRRAGDGSVRIRIYFSHLAPFKISLPAIEEQKAIANILDIAHCEITMLETKAELLKMQKKWLMQQLLTGKKRLKLKEE